jgi:hypothetical protein
MTTESGHQRRTLDPISSGYRAQMDSPFVTCTLSCHDPQVRNRPGSYTAYSVGCAMVWAVILAAFAGTGKREKLRAVLPVCAGWWIGWTSATIARYVYPPPKSRPPWTRNRQG